MGANYRAACRGRSKAEFVAKIGIVIEEADESMYWMEMLIEAGIVSNDELDELISEANEMSFPQLVIYIYIYITTNNF